MQQIQLSLLVITTDCTSSKLQNYLLFEIWLPYYIKNLQKKVKQRFFILTESEFNYLKYLKRLTLLHKLSEDVGFAFFLLCMEIKIY